MFTDQLWHSPFESLLSWSHCAPISIVSSKWVLFAVANAFRTLFSALNSDEHRVDAVGEDTKMHLMHPKLTQRATSHHAQNPWIVIVLIVGGQLLSLPLLSSQSSSSLLSDVFQLCLSTFCQHLITKWSTSWSYFPLIFPSPVFPPSCSPVQTVVTTSKYTDQLLW